MKVLIAEDDPVTRRMLEAILTKWEYEVIVACDGIEALAILQREGALSLVILDWMMPGIDGLALCQRIREKHTQAPIYIILLTTKGQKEDIIAGFEAGADDYITKPFDREELRARINVGKRIVELQKSLTDRLIELENALLHVRQLQGLLPICSYCKKIRDDQNYWQQIEEYVTNRSDAQFTHSICPDCYEKYVVPELKQIKAIPDDK